MKKIFVIIFVLLIAFIVYVTFKSKTQIFEGVVYDCETNEPISNARVQIHLGNSTLNFLSDSGRNYEGQTDNSGNFKIQYAGGPGNVTVDKYEKYLSAMGTFLGGKTKIGMIKKTQKDNVADYSISCKRSFECTKKEIINGVETLTTICDMSLPKI